MAFSSYDSLNMQDYCNNIINKKVERAKYTLVEDFDAAYLEQTLNVKTVIKNETGEEGYLVFMIVNLKTQQSTDLQSYINEHGSKIATGLNIEELKVFAKFFKKNKVDKDDLKEEISILSQGDMYYNRLQNKGKIKQLVY